MTASDRTALLRLLYPERMQRLSITRAAVAHPPFRISQAEAAARIGQVCGEPRKAAAVAKGSQIHERALCLPPEQISALGAIEERNRLYARHAPALALEAATKALRAPLSASPRGDRDVRFLASCSCTGYMVPGWDIGLVQELDLPCDTVRLPITQAGCAGGVLSLARAADHLRSRPGAALVVACEICSLAFQRSSDEGNLTSALIFADGAGAALLESATPPGALEIVDSVSLLSPAPASVLGFQLTDGGFAPQLSRELVSVLPPATARALDRLLAPHGLVPPDIEYWLLHPGGSRILTQIEHSLAIDRCRTRWSWDSLAACGNTSSAAIFDVLRRYLNDPAAPDGWGVVAAFGPGVSIELLLVRRC